MRFPVKLSPQMERKGVGWNRVKQLVVSILIWVCDYWVAANLRTKWSSIYLHYQPWKHSVLQGGSCFTSLFLVEYFYFSSCPRFPSAGIKVCVKKFCLRHDDGHYIQFNKYLFLCFKAAETAKVISRDDEIYEMGREKPYSYPLPKRSSFIFHTCIRKNPSEHSPC